MALPKPTSNIDWTDGSPAKSVEPSAGKKLLGWVALERPPFEFANFLHFNTDEWVKYLESVTDDIVALSTAVQNAIGNNQAAPANLAGLVFDKSLIRGFQARYQLDRRTDSSNTAEIGTILGFVDPEADAWLPIVQNSNFDDGLGEGGVTLDIVASSGQLRYSSTDISGANYAGELRVLDIVKFAI